MRNTFVLGGAAAVAIASAASATTYTGSGGTIPDNNPTGFSSVINVTDDFIVKDITISLVGLTHTWIGDLVVSITKMDGGANPSQFLFNRVGKTVATTGFGDSSNLGGTYSFNDAFTGNLWTAAEGGGTDFTVPGGNYFASGALSSSQVLLKPTFAGLHGVGMWKITIVDAAGGDLGSLGSWTLTFEKNPVPAPGALALLGLAGLAGSRRRRA